jgi:hypothetical protein
MKPTKLLSQLGLYLTIALWAAAPLILSGCGFTNTRGANTREEVVETYLESLKTKDEKLMLQLIREELSAQTAIQDKITQLGGHQIQDRKILYEEVIKPQLVSVTIQGTYNGGKEKFADKISLSYEMVSSNSGRWFLILGKGKSNVLPPHVTPATFP